MSKMRVGMITLGCDKNTVDNEYLAGMLEDGGAELVAISTRAAAATLYGALDAVVVTTCGFIGDAKQESIRIILELAAGKRESSNPARLYVAGCLAQRYAKPLLDEIPEIDGIVGVGQFKQLAAMILDARRAPHDRNAVSRVPSVEIYSHLRRRRLDQRPYAFLKIADGCNHSCAFCSIPLMKGRLRSVPPKILLEEARALLAQGARELNLVAQDISVYGADCSGHYRLPQLLHDLCALDGDFWIRCLYCYPGGVSDQLLGAMATEPKIVPYLDIPLQHLDPDVLRRMKRPAHDLNTTQLVERLRRAIPGLAIRTTMLVGFPGETPQAHQRMLDGMRTLAFTWLGAFQFSREEDTVAAHLPRQVGKTVREKRWRAVMELQAEISASLNQRRIGQRLGVLLESYDESRRLWLGRSPGEAPEVDGAVLVKPEPSLRIGQFITVEITAADVYDLYGHVAGVHNRRGTPH